MTDMQLFTTCIGVAIMLTIGVLGWALTRH
jgi:hypothetical protein